ncbi:hypothetical protein K1719_010656 [Acacia pycnantha]|nr:hypothetical protein K1719_010656 [Acacia pycnantha]
MDKSWIKQSCVLVCDVSLRSGKHEILALEHLLVKPFPKHIHSGGSWGATWYGIWAPSSSNLEVGNQVHQDDPVNEAVRDAFGVQDDNFTGRGAGSRPLVFFRNDAAREFFSLMDESDRPLYQGCQKYSKLSFLIKLYHIKCMCLITDKAMSMFWNYFEMLSQADIPSSFYEAKKIIND